MRIALPEIEYHPYNDEDGPSGPKNYSREEYDDFLEEFKEYIEGDCHALTVDGEVIFNSYDTTKPIKMKILDDVVRNRIIENPHGSLFVYCFREEVDKRIVVYMFEHPWFLVINYVAETKTFVTNKYASTAYINWYQEIQQRRHA